MVLDAPVLGFIVATRAMLAAGVGLLIADRLPPERRRIIGTIMVAAGAAATIPAAFSVIRGMRRGDRRPLKPGVEFDPGLIGATRFARRGDEAVEVVAEY
jgi:hypothetical protein